MGPPEPLPAGLLGGSASKRHRKGSDRCIQTPSRVTSIARERLILASWRRSPHRRSSGRREETEPGLHRSWFPSRILLVDSSSVPMFLQKSSGLSSPFVRISRGWEASRHQFLSVENIRTFCVPILLVTPSKSRPVFQTNVVWRAAAHPDVEVSSLPCFAPREVLRSGQNTEGSHLRDAFQGKAFLKGPSEGRSWSRMILGR